MLQDYLEYSYDLLHSYHHDLQCQEADDFDCCVALMLIDQIKVVLNVRMHLKACSCFSLPHLEEQTISLSVSSSEAWKVSDDGEERVDSISGGAEACESTSLSQEFVS